jgi:hypothetical protein
MLRYEAEAVAVALAEHRYRDSLPSGAVVSCDWPPKGAYRATHLTLPPLPPMTIFEAVERGLISLTGCNMGRYHEAVRAMINEQGN